MGYDFKIEWTGQGNITSKVSSLSIVDNIGQYAREMTLEISDPDYWSQFDFSTIPIIPEITISTMISDTWVQQGQFFIERPSLNIERHSERIKSIWGRSKTALFGPPFAGKLNKTWTTDTTFYTIVEEMCDLVGITYDASLIDPSDYLVYAYSFSAELIYPIDVIKMLADAVGAFPITDKDDQLRIIKFAFTPTGPAWEVTDLQLQSMQEAPEWPEFGNRIKITPGGNVAGFSTELQIEDQCLPNDGASWARMVVQVIDGNGDCVNDVPVNWTHDGSAATLAYAASNTQPAIFENIEVTANTYFEFDLPFAPSQIDSVYAYSDKSRSDDLSANGVTISGKIITLTDQLSFCDQKLRVTYRACGIAVNYLTAGTTAEDVLVSAGVGGDESTGYVYIGNPCKCPINMSLEAFPTTINVGENSTLLVYVEDSGPVTDGRIVYMSEGTASQKKGTLQWDYTTLGTVQVNNEKVVARNEIAGTTQCIVNKYINSSVTVFQDDGTGSPTGSDLYSAHNGKTIDLNTVLNNGIDLLVSYKFSGAAINVFIGNYVGTARIVAFLSGRSEQAIEAWATVNIVEKDSGQVGSTLPGDAPFGWEPPDQAAPIPGPPGGEGGGGGPSVTPSVDPNKQSGCGLTQDEDGNTTEVICADGEVCCHSDGGFGCNDPDDCDTVNLECAPDNVMGDPTTAKLAARFDEPRDTQGCTCESICLYELQNFETTQGYDSGSGRTIEEIVVQDHGLAVGTPEYWEKYSEIRTAALDDCKTACGTCTGTISYTTLAMGVNEQQSLSISGGDETGPVYTWAITFGGGSLNTAGDGLTTVYTAPATNPECANGPTIALSCGGEVIDTITMQINDPSVLGDAYHIITYVDDCPSGRSLVRSIYNCAGVEQSSASCDGCSPCNVGSFCDSQQWVIDHCISVGACDGLCNPGTYDVRSAGMVTGGCCPEALY